MQQEEHQNKFLPAELLHQKLLKHQRKQQTKKQTKIIKSESKSNISSKQDSLLGNSNQFICANILHNLDDEDRAENDDNGAAIADSGIRGDSILIVRFNNNRGICNETIIFYLLNTFFDFLYFVIH